MYIYIFIPLVVCLTTGPKPLPKRALHLMRSRASSFKCEYPLLSVRSSSSFLYVCIYIVVFETRDYFVFFNFELLPIPVVALSKAWASSRLLANFADWNPAEVVDVCVL